MKKTIPSFGTAVWMTTDHFNDTPAVYFNFTCTILEKPETKQVAFAFYAKSKEASLEKLHELVTFEDAHTQKEIEKMFEEAFDRKSPNKNSD